MSRWLALLSILVLSAAARAATPDEQAAAQYAIGIAAFNLAQYEPAIAAFEAAYRHKEDPKFLFNTAQAHRLAGHGPLAVRFYRSYLRLVPDSPLRAAIEARIAELDKPESPAVTLIAAPAPTLVAIVPAATPPERRGQTKRIVGLVIAGVGVVSLAAGFGLGVRARQVGDELTQLDQDRGTFDQALQQRGRLDQNLAAALLPIGGIAIVSGVVVAVLGFRQ